MLIQGGPKTGLFLWVDNFATVNGIGRCIKYIKSFQYSSRKKYKTWMSVKLNILCLVGIHIQCIWNYAEFDNNTWNLPNFQLYFRHHFPQCNTSPNISGQLITFVMLGAGWGARSESLLATTAAGRSVGIAVVRECQKWPYLPQCMGRHFMQFLAVL